MKHLYLFSLLSLGLVFSACGGSEGQEVSAGDAITADEAGNVQNKPSTQYLVDPAASTVVWEGTKVVGGGHTGTIPVENGQLIVTDGDNKLVAGQFALDLRNMTNTDLPEEDAKKLLGHLQSPDFFDVAQYPMINFDLKRIEEAQGKDYSHELTGNLKMKGKERSVTLPANVTIDGGKLTAKTPKFTIDRNDWGVSYGNSITEKVKDNIISDEIGLEIELVANQE